MKVEDKLYCYLLVTSYILPQVGYDWKKAADWCRKSDANFVQYCFQSYGRDASGTAREDPDGIDPELLERGKRRAGVHLRRRPRHPEQQPE